MKRSTTLWLLAFIITAASAYYQRRTGPTYPIRGQATLGLKHFSYRLTTSHGGESDCPVLIRTDDSAVSGTLEWRHHDVDEGFRQSPMTFSEGVLKGALPHQPPAGKLDFRIVLRTGSATTVLPERAPAVIRFKGDVPGGILIPHIVAMFAAMFLSTRAGLEIFNPKPNLKALTYSTLGFLAMGGLLLGPIMQKYAFGSYWTGWPYGIDLTDNKTLVALLGWISAAIALHKARKPEIWAAAAAVILLAVYMIPHSVLGSELKYQDQRRHSGAPEEDSSDLRGLAPCLRNLYAKVAKRNFHLSG
jgi:hypothetical protein